MLVLTGNGLDSITMNIRGLTAKKIKVKKS